MLELGGKSPAIIDESANAGLAAKKVLFGKMPNLGQVCIAPDYVMCHESKVNSFVDALKQSIRDGYNDCETPEDSGKIINEFHYTRLCNLLKDHGGEVVYGNANAAQDMNLKPTIVMNPRKDSTLMREEIFGPIFPILTYKSIDEAVDYISQEQEKPLVVYYFGKTNNKNQQIVEQRTHSGGLVVNDTIYQILNPDLPFGGVGHSGYGRYHGEEGFKQFSNMKSVLVKYQLDIWPYNIIFPPYTEEVKQMTLKSLNSGTITQSKMCKIIAYTCLAITIIVLGIVYRADIYDLIEQKE